MLQGFIDDSGSEPNDPMFVLGGFVAPAHRWEDFADAWDQKLKEDIPLDYFKSTEANGARGQFAITRGWARKAINKRVEELAEIAANHAAFRVATLMRWADFRVHLKSIGDEIIEPFNLVLRDPYFVCLSALRLRIHAYCKHHRIDPLCFYTLDDQSAVGDFAVRVHDILKSTPALAAFLGGTPRFDSDRDVVPLQAADLYAYHRHDEAVTGGKERYAQVRQTLSRVPNIEMILDERYLGPMRETLMKSAASAPEYLKGGGANKLIGFSS